jgi:hypothetical protein
VLITELSFTAPYHLTDAKGATLLASAAASVLPPWSSAAAAAATGLRGLSAKAVSLAHKRSR